VACCGDPELAQRIVAAERAVRIPGSRSKRGWAGAASSAASAGLCPGPGELLVPRPDPARPHPGGKGLSGEADWGAIARR